uniref:Serpin domain-containing protein n=1 Tax=Timema poppense TaxID=170557 RepID=A0A7R9CYC5_TIMPO|nr:unnamed protein product [Timema poppensis]
MVSHLGKTALGTPDRDSNLDLPVIGSLVYCESSVLDHAATEAVSPVISVTTHPVHPTEIRTSISLSSAVERNTTGALANYATEEGNQVVEMMNILLLLVIARDCKADVLNGIHLVTTLSNSLVPKLFQALSPGRENLVFAPFGLASNVAMLLEGSDGNTAQEIYKALNIQPKSIDDLRLGFKAYFDSFESSAGDEEPAGSFNMAILRSSDVLSPSYKSVLAQYYRANITDTPVFDNRSGIPPSAQVLELRSDSGVMSHWKDYHRLAAFAFLSHVASAPFRRSPSETVQVPMIPQVGVFRTGRVDHLKCEAVELPLEAEAVSLLLLVPDSSDHLDEMIVKLSDVSLQQLVSWLTPKETEVSLPQLAILSSSLDLTTFLRQLGVRAAFNSSSADLTKASLSGGGEASKGVYAKSVMQDAYFSTSFVAVNSVGSVSVNAGACVCVLVAFLDNSSQRIYSSPMASLVLTDSSQLTSDSQHLMPRRPKRETSSTLIVDRPFLFFLLHRDTQLAILAGKVQNPTQVP